MREKEVINLLKEHIKKNYNDDWEYGYGRQKLTKAQFLKKLKKDKEFRKFVVNQLDGLTVDLLTRPRG